MCRYISYFTIFQGYATFDKDVHDWLTLIIGRDYRKFRTKIKRMDRVSINYIINAFELVEKESAHCRRSEALKRHEDTLNNPQMQQDINIISENSDNDGSILIKNGLISELKDMVEAKNTFADKQRKIIENQNDLIFKLTDEKDRMQRDIANLKQEMVIDRSRKYLPYIP